MKAHTSIEWYSVCVLGRAGEGKGEACLEQLWYHRNGKWQKSQCFGMQGIMDNHSEVQIFLQRKQVKTTIKG